MHANKENLLYYNSLYEKQLRKKFRGPNKQKKQVTINRSRSWLGRIFCCFKCTRRAKLKAEKIVIPVVEYSEGESGEEENRLGRKFLKMKEREKDQHTRRLWARLLVKAKGASLINLKFEGLKRRMYLFGTSTKLKFEIGSRCTIRKSTVKSPCSPWVFQSMTTTIRIRWSRPSSAWT